MKHFLRSLTSFTAAAVIAFCSTGVCYAVAADTTADTTTCTVHFDISEDGVYIPEDEDGNVPELNDMTIRLNSSERIPSVAPEKEGYLFSCWTYDDIFGYCPGDVFQANKEEITFHPVWIDNNDKEFHKITFKVEYDGVTNTEAEKLVPPINLIQGRYFNPPLYVFPPSGYKQRGWTDGVTEFYPETKIIVHDKDMVLTPNLKKIYTLKYSVGDADRINGTIEQIYENAESFSTDLQRADRFSRSGFTISGWHCETDGLDYELGAKFIMPGNDVLMTPIWEPLRYVVVFKPGSVSSEFIKVPGYTDTTIVVPECTVTKEGYTFGGWKYEDTVVQPGEEYLIKGAPSGMGIAFSAVWNEKSEPESPVKAFEISVVDKETGEPINDVRLKAQANIVEAGESRSSGFPIDGMTENPKKVSYKDLDKIDSVSVSDFTLLDDAYNGYAYKLDANDIVTRIDNGTAFYTVKLTKKVYPDDVAPYSYVVKAVDKETGELVNDAVLYGGWYIQYGDSMTGPMTQLDMSVANPAIISYAKYKDATVCSFDIHGVTADSAYTLSEEDITHETDEENHVPIITVKLTKKDIAYGDTNCDGKVELSDAILIMQALANPNKYGVKGNADNHLTAQGALNGDVDPSTKGLTADDALTIQLYLLKKIESLPATLEEPVID